MISLISAIAIMIYFVLMRTKSRSNLLTYSTGAASPTATPVSWTARSGLVDASKEPFVYCYECSVPFWGSPEDIVHHLTQACGDHYWPLAKNIKYEPLAIAAPTSAFG